jgi:septal ring factor EnvC (AmiA/AmiB activator)
MDVTSEYAKVAQQIKKSTNMLSSIEKLGRIGVIIGFVTGISVAALSLVMFFSASSKLKVLMQTNTELLTVFVENVDIFNENIAKLEPALNDINLLTKAVDKVGSGMIAYGDKSEMMGSEIRVAIETMNGITPAVRSQMADMQEKTSVMNSELTMSLAEMTNEEFKAQNMIMGNFTRSVIDALQSMSDTSVDVKEQRAAVQSLQDVNAELAARIATLDQRLDTAKREASRARKAAAAKPKKQAANGDIIKFP